MSDASGPSQLAAALSPQGGGTCCVTCLLSSNTCWTLPPVEMLGGAKTHHKKQQCLVGMPTTAMSSGFVKPHCEDSNA